MRETDFSEENRVVFIRNQLLPLSPWSILPATETSNLQMYNQQTILDQLLVPLNKAESVIDFVDCGVSSQRLVKILRQLGLPELNSVILTTMDTGTGFKMASYNLARDLVATVTTPHSLVPVLKRKLQTNAHFFDDKLKASDAIVVLDYFSRNIGSQTDVDKETLRKLPFYPTANGGLAKLEGNKVFLVPPENPQGRDARCGIHS